MALIDRPKSVFKIKEYDLPEIKSGEALIRTEMAGVCGTDVHLYDGHLNWAWPDFPLVFGHETAGTLAELGDGVETDSVEQPVKIGDQVIVLYGAPCGRCGWA